MSQSTAKTILLGHLDHDPVVMAMPGQAARITQIDDLLASIPAQGLLQSLKVRISSDASIYLVTAGNRRLASSVTHRLVPFARRNQFRRANSG